LIDPDRGFKRDVHPGNTQSYIFLELVVAQPTSLLFPCLGVQLLQLVIVDLIISHHLLVMWHGHGNIVEVNYAPHIELFHEIVCIIIQLLTTIAKKSLADMHHSTEQLQNKKKKRKKNTLRVFPRAPWPHSLSRPNPAPLRPPKVEGVTVPLYEPEG
jgi:hypothetical protein